MKMRGTFLLLIFCAFAISSFAEKTPDPYKILQISKTASGKEIKAAYKRLAKEW